jgi:hypothetical protein
MIKPGLLLTFLAIFISILGLYLGNIKFVPSFATEGDGALTVSSVVGTGAWNQPVAISPTNTVPAGAHAALANQTDTQLDAVSVKMGNALLPFGDADGDGLLNSWEQNGIDYNNDGTIDLTLPNANPLHKDLYVEVDYMRFHRPNQVALNHVIGNFSIAPLSNPDGIRGINLHVLVDELIPHQPTTDMAALQIIKNTNFGTPAERSDPNSYNIHAAKQLVYHYSLFAHDQAPPYVGSSGRSNGIPAMDFIVTLGAPGWGTDPLTGHTIGSVDQQEGTFMHELGHNLGLGHGGADGINCKPNYLSVMTYSRQFSSIIGNRPLDYSRSVLAQLNEANLNENSGISASTPPGLTTVYGPAPIRFGSTGVPIDWIRDGDTVDTGIGADISNMGFNGCGPGPNEILNGYDDWNHLRLVLGAPGASLAEAIVQPQQSLPELTVNDTRQQRVLLLDGINEALGNLPNTAFKQPTAAEGLKSTLNKTTQPTTGDIAVLLKSDKLDSAIAKLSDIRSKADSSFGGSEANDIISSPVAQKNVVPLIDNLIMVLEKQK